MMFLIVPHFSQITIILFKKNQFNFSNSFETVVHFRCGCKIIQLIVIYTYFIILEVINSTGKITSSHIALLVTLYTNKQLTDT